MPAYILHADTHAPGGVDPLDFDALTIGESTMSRREVSSTGTALGSSGSLRLSYFTARKTETVTQLRLMTGGTAAGATPTLCRAGIYSDDDAGALTLVGAIANDTALFAGGSTAYTRALTASFVKTAGIRYAVGILVVTGATLPTFTGQNALNAPEALIAPRISSVLAAQTDLPSSITNASLAVSGSVIYSVVLP